MTTATLALVSLENAAVDDLALLRGAFSLVFADESTLFAARDPQGIRPLVLGRLERGWVVASSDNVRLVQDQIREWVPGRYVALGTDGFGRSETRGALRRHFEIDAESVAFAALSALAADGDFDSKKLPGVLKDLGIDPDKVDPMGA